MAHFHALVIDRQSAAETTGAVGVPMSQVTESTWYVTYGANTTAGVVTLEAAPRSDYAGTWAVVATVSWAAASRTHYVSLTGVHAAVRARISTAIVGGTVTVEAVGR